jgi:hypothetical protein
MAFPGMGTPAEVLVFVQPPTVLAWHRTRFREHWARLNRTGRPGPPAISTELRELSRQSSAANPRGDAPRIQGESRKVGIAVGKSTVEQYRIRPRRPPAPAWRAFLRTHVTELVPLGFFTVATVGLKVLCVLVVLAHDRRKVLHCNVTESPTAQWAAQQLVEAFPLGTAPKYVLRDRDAVYGDWVQRRITHVGGDQVLVQEDFLGRQLARSGPVHTRRIPERESERWVADHLVVGLIECQEVCDGKGSSVSPRRVLAPG